MNHIRINDKLRLESVTVELAPIIFETIDRDREYLRQWLPFVNFTFQLSDTEQFLRGVSAKSNRRDFIYGIWYKEEFAGLIGFKDTDWANKRTEIGYWLAENMQHKGIITACVKKLIQVAFNKFRLHRIQIKVAEENQKSEAIPQKLNFTLEGTERSGELHGDKFLNLRVYSLLATDR